MRRWQKCPVCEGVGSVSNGYYNRTGDIDHWATTDLTPEHCRTCNGRGIILEAVDWSVKEKE